jgi:hypothetical protein
MQIPKSAATGYRKATGTKDLNSVKATNHIQPQQTKKTVNQAIIIYLSHLIKSPISEPIILKA